MGRREIIIALRSGRLLRKDNKLLAGLWASLMLDRSRGRREILIAPDIDWPRWDIARADISRLNTVGPIVIRTGSSRWPATWFWLGWTPSLCSRGLQSLLPRPPRRPFQSFSYRLRPVASGFVARLNRPGGNVTGIAVLNTQVTAKRLQLLGELVPTAKSVGFLYSPTGLVTGYDGLLKDMESAADALGLKLLLVEVSGPDDFERAFAKLASAQSEALLLSADASMIRNRERLAS